MRVKIFPVLALIWCVIAAVQVILDAPDYATVSALIAVVMSVLATTED